MSRFKKAIKYTETLVSLDEKIAKANQEFEKTGVDLVEITNSTSGIYYADKENPGTDAVMTPVPDPNGVRESGYAQPSNGYNASDSSTWDNAYPNTDWLYNSNDVGGETDRPVLLSPNTPPTGQTIGRFGPGGGLVRATIGHGTGLGYLKPDNTYQMVLSNSYWGTLHIPNDSNRYGGDAPYRGYTDDEWALLQDAYTKMLGTTFTREIKFWDSYSYFWYGSWEGYAGTKKEVAGGARYVLKGGYISGDPHDYESTPATPPTTTIIFRDPLDKVENLPTDRGRFWELLKKLFGISEPPLEVAGGLPYTADDDPFGADDSGDDWEDDSDIPGDFPFDFASAAYGGMYDIDGKGWSVTGDQLRKMQQYPERYNLSPGELKLIQRLKVQKKTLPIGLDVAHHESEGEVLTEKNHLRDLREKKREKTKKVADKIIKINIPGPKDHLTVRAIDMLRSYKVSEKEMQEYVVIIGRINQWIRDNPKEYEIWKVRYPANDPRLAELNWRMDQQLRASKEYVDSRFPENVRLFDKLKQKIETNIQVTDPANFKDVKPVVTHKKLLQVSKAIGPLTNT